MFREVKNNIGQFMTVFVMAFVALMGVAGLGAQNMDSFNRYLEDVNYRDLELVGASFSYADIDRLGMISGVSDVEGWYNTTGTVTLDTKRKLCLSFITDNDISQCLVSEGEPFSPEKTGVWIDESFYEAMGLHVGDLITIESEGARYTEIIRGAVYNPQYLYYVPDSTYVEPEYGEFGFGILSISEYAGTEKYFDQLLVDVDGVTGDLNPDGMAELTLSRVSDEIYNIIDQKNLVVNTKAMDNQVLVYTDSTNSTQALMFVFPPIYILVGLLGISSTMTKMISRQRTTIGTLKALGIKSSVIHLHYISYSFFIVLIGCILGAVAGYYLIGNMMLDSMLYYFLNPYEHLIITPFIAVVSVIFLIASVIVTYLCNKKLLAMNTSRILQPEAPDDSKSSFYEKLSLWKRLKFATRWNVRDISNNVGRTIVSIIGIILCSTLMFAALGSYESMTKQPDWLYKEIITSRYNMSFSDSITTGQAEDYACQYGGQLVQDTAITAVAGENSAKLHLMVLDDGNYYHITDMEGKYTQFPKDGILLSYRAAEMLDADIGDFITFSIDGEKETYTDRITGFCRSPVQQGVFVPREYWQAQHAKFCPTNLYTNVSIPQRLESRTEIESIKTIDEYHAALIRSNATLNMAMFLIIVIAVFLGSFILYNMGSTAYVEKSQSMATLKVLGFSSENLQNILMQQNAFITAVGALIGLIPGYYAIGILLALMGDNIDCLVRISAYPYILASAGTFFISYLINRLIVRKIKFINMVIALKGE